MPVDKQVLLRYQVLNKCFRNRYREYTIDDLVNECNKALHRIDKPDVSKRTVQNDIKTKPLHSSWDIIEEGDNYTTISITVKLNKELEALILSFGDDIEVLEPVDFRRRIADKIKGMNEKYNQI